MKMQIFYNPKFNLVLQFQTHHCLKSAELPDFSFTAEWM
jgi:hypothetical protein